MAIHMMREIERLKRQVLSLSALVEENVQLSGRALRERDVELADQARRRDLQVDQKEIEVEEECLKILALHQPVAIDLRYVVSVLKINNDLERIGDLAVNIANKAEYIAENGPLPITIDFDAMFQRARDMLQRALDSLIQMDTETAREVCADDDAVDALKREIRAQIIAAIEEFPSSTRILLAANGVARNLERIADLATNIAEDVIYMIDGEIVRHAHEMIN